MVLGLVILVTYFYFDITNMHITAKYVGFCGEKRGISYAMVCRVDEKLEM